MKAAWRGWPLLLTLAFSARAALCSAKFRRQGSGGKGALWGNERLFTVTCDWPRYGEWRTIENDQEPDARFIPTGWVWVDIMLQADNVGSIEPRILRPQHGSAIRGLLNGELSPSVLLVNSP